MTDSKPNKVRTIKVLWKMLKDYATGADTDVEQQDDNSNKIVTIFGMILNFAYRVGKAFFERKQRVRAASLTYFTFVSLVPTIAFLRWFSKAVNAHTPMRPVLVRIFPGFISTFDELSHFANEYADKLYTNFFGILAILFILYCVYCMFVNIQRIFERQWNSTERKGAAQFQVVFESLIISGVAILLCAYGFSKIGKLAWDIVIAGVILFICITGAFYHMPYDKKPNVGATFASAGLTTVLLLVWTLLLPVIDKYIATYQSTGILVFLLMFWLYGAWLITLFGAKLCRWFDRRDVYFSYKNSNLSSSFQCYISMFIASYIYRRAFESNGVIRGVSYEDIRKDAFLCDDKDSEPSKDADSNKVLLPRELLDKVLNYLKLKNIISVEVGNSNVIYYPKASAGAIEKYTVSDFLYDYYINGNNLSDHSYENVCSIDNDLAEDMMDTFLKPRYRTTPIIEIRADQPLKKEDSNQYMATRRATYNSKKKQAQDQAENAETESPENAPVKVKPAPKKSFWRHIFPF